MIRHTVVFSLKRPQDVQEEKSFWRAINELSAIPGVQHFEYLKQTSTKNNFEYGLSMEFDDANAYEQYSNHPIHVNFVQQYWLKEVEDFLEIDYEPLN